MISLKCNGYCVVRNPIKRDAEGNAVEENGQAKLDFGEVEYRFIQPPFPLYLGEVTAIAPTQFESLSLDEALLLSATASFTDSNGNAIAAGEKWLFEGPGLYKPRKEVTILRRCSAHRVEDNTAICIRATEDFTDENGNLRVAGEKSLIRGPRTYMLGAYEEFANVVHAYNLDARHALHVRALKSHADDFGRWRERGEEWLITCQDTESHIPSVNEEVIEVVEPVVLTSRNYCVVCDPVDEDGVPGMGKRLLVRGAKSFFLQPGESLLDGIQDVYVLSEEDGLLLTALTTFTDGGKKRLAGEKWLLTGPLEYVPPLEVKVSETRKAISLAFDEGVYVRNRDTGKVRSVVGTTYMLKVNEVLWEKKLSPELEELLRLDGNAVGGHKLNTDPALRDRQCPTSESVDFNRFRVITYRIPQNHVSQIYDFTLDYLRFVFGPELVKLTAYEEFKVYTLSVGRAGEPKAIKTICIPLGPELCHDSVDVKTADHVACSIKLAYQWKFKRGRRINNQMMSELSSLNDFIGYLRFHFASRIRRAVLEMNLEQFLANQDKVINEAVCGTDQEGKINRSISFHKKTLFVKRIDVLSVEPTGMSTAEALLKSAEFATEMASKNVAKYVEERLEEEARGCLELTKLEEETKRENARKNLLTLQAEMKALLSNKSARRKWRFCI